MNLESITVQEAVRSSLQTEKNAMDFYRLSALKMQDPESRREQIGVVPGYLQFRS